jgi:hypothetical protein
MAFVLVSKTRGDDLIPPEKKNVYVSRERKILEDEKERRSKARSERLSTLGDEIPWWAEASLIADEVIEEVQEIIP